jgi:LuxR family transcriptional regulator, maltose regulon positive regulatory protein
LGNTKGTEQETMPKAAQYILVWSAEQHTYALYGQGQRYQALLQGDEERWLTWLTTHTSFSFQGKHGHFNAQKERRPRGGEGYWYAYQRQGKRIAKKYVGRTTDLVMARLEEVAQYLTQEANQLPTGALHIHDQAESFQESLLVSKLSPPRLPSLLVSRQHLLTRLDAGLDGALTLLSAPAGFGKTTLVRQWIADRGTRLPPVAWVSLDPGDNDPVRFWRYLITAYQVFRADLGKSALTQLSMAFLPSLKPLALEAVLTRFLNELTHQAPEGLLILEDYHTLTSPQVERTMTFFLDHLPTTLHLVILTQHDPSLPLARLRARDDLCELRAADLRFSQEETALFLQRASAIIPATLSPETFQSLTARLEGWAAGLRLLALALQGRTTQQEVEQVLATFTGDHPSLQEYFVSEVLHRQSEATQDFLLRTSVLSRLTGSLCDALTERLDSAPLLAALDRAGFFLEPLDGSGPWYRYHALFADSMRAEARRHFGEERVRSLSFQASRWYAEHNLLTEAVEAALEARNFAFAAGLIERIEDLLHQNFTEASTLYDFRSLSRWLEQIPDQLLRQRPALCLVSAAALLLVSLSDQHSVTRLPTKRLEGFLQLAEQGWRRTGTTSRLGEVFAFRSLLARQQGELIQAATWARQALAWLPEEELAWRSVSLSVVGAGELLNGQVALAQKLFEEGRACCEALGNRSFMRATSGMLSEVYVEQGKLHLAAEQFRQLLAEARAQEDRDDVARVQLALAQLFYEWNDLQASRLAAQEALELSRLLSNEEIEVRAALVLARIEHAQGQMALARQRLTDLLTRIPPSRSPLFTRLSREVLAMQAMLQLAIGDLSTVQRWASERDQPGEALPLASQGREDLLVARWLLAQSKTEEALDLLGHLLDTAHQMERVRFSLEIRVVMVLTQAAHQHIQEAKQLLRAVLEAAYAEGYLRLFLDEGAVIETLLRALVPHVRQQALASYLQSILHAFARERVERGDRSPAPALASSPLIEPLSAHEQRVLRLLAAGRSNPEIARELIVSVNTVRTQVQSIYRKLDVKNRVEACEAARLLQLL